ncbi:MAG TPA: RNA polymerase sigma factor [Acidimicrobiales bacterium]|nr:RNA polymerase sigma factor [Acidimicrobiales bacterium]
MDHLAGRLASDLDRAFPDVVRAHQDAVYSIALRLTGRPADAEDAAQDAFVRAYRALQGWDARRRADVALRPWLARITLNVCRNRARAAGRRPVTAPLDGRADPPAPGDGSTGALRAELAAELAGALRRLPEPQRRAVVLHHAGGLTYAEVAGALDRPEGTVKADVHRALKTLRSLLDRPEDE